MAKIKFGMIVTDGRGKLGGQVFSKNRAGSYIRTKVTPVNPATTSQSAARSLFGSISQQWSGLSDTVRNGWNAAVSEWQKTDIFGDLKLPSGKALFQRLNNQAQSVGYAAVTSAPSKEEMVSGIITGALLSVTNFEITLTGAYSGAGARIVLYATPQLSDGTTFVKNKLRQIYTAVGNAYDVIDAYDAYVIKYPAPAVNSNVYLAVKYVLPNGQASPLQIIKATVS